jgi:hypothetical protein
MCGFGPRKFSGSVLDFLAMARRVHPLNLVIPSEARNPQFACAAKMQVPSLRSK